MAINNLTRGFIRLAIALYIICVIGLGIVNFVNQSKNFYMVSGQLNPYLSYSGDMPMFWGNEWCARIAQDDYATMSEADKMRTAEYYWTQNIEPLADDFGYDVKKFKEWFFKYAVVNVENMPIREFTFNIDRPAIKYRDIDLDKMPPRKLSYFFLQPELFRVALIPFAIIYIPILVIFFVIRWVYLGFKTK